jgi:hypothetical protein
MILPREGAESMLQGVTSAPSVFKRVSIFLCWVYEIKTIHLQLPGPYLIKHGAALSMRSRLTILSQGFHLFVLGN